ncbi:MAG TPA: hypothetical protein VHB77_02820, partial [Planctomycetaceae bacterium]|nr:hypothetical protein [Planctomycetaceae bacterium]
CHGSRYQRDVLEAKYRGLSIADVLAMTVREALPFFRGQPKLQRRLNALRSVGLDYLALGQSADTLSGGESQRLKLAERLTQRSGRRTLFLLDEPTTGLHPHDVATLLECFDALLSTGHSLIVIEHNLDLLQAADWIIELGPGGGAAGGRLIGQGTPEELASSAASPIGKFLKG